MEKSRGGFEDHLSVEAQQLLGGSRGQPSVEPLKKKPRLDRSGVEEVREEGSMFPHATKKPSVDPKARSEEQVHSHADYHRKSSLPRVSMYAC